VQRREERIILAALVAAVGSIAVSLVAAPAVPFMIRSQILHVTLETSAAGVAFLAALLVLGRFQRRRQLRDLLQVAAFLFFALANLLFVVAPAIAGHPATDPFDVWAAFGARLFGGLCFLASAWLGPRRVHRRGAAVLLVAAVGVCLLLIATVVGVFADRLPTALGLPASAAFDPAALAAYRASTVGRVFGFGLMAGAAVGFARQLRRGAPEFTAWLGGGAVLFAAAQLHFALFPSMHAQVVYTGDYLRFGFYVMVLVGSIREIMTHSRQLVAGAASEERRRIARELHDGLAQELAFIYTTLDRAQDTSSCPVHHGVLANAARRALDESRRAIDALSTPADESLPSLLTRLAADLESRDDIRIELDAPPVPGLPPETREELFRIAREAINNAVRHSGSPTIRVWLRTDPDLELHVRDDGCGFRTGEVEVTGQGFGLTSMRERAEALGGALHIRSAPDNGTEVTAVFPGGATHR
jgi:signal transduction histidine kinase